MSTLLQDVRYALRLCFQRPALTVVTVLTLAIGVGGTTAIFTVVNGLLIRPLPVGDPDRLVRVFGATDRQAFDVLSYSNAVDLGTRAKTLDSLAIHQQTFVAVGLGDETETAAIELVSGNYFATFAVAAAIGRTILPQDDALNAGQQVAVISDRWWTTRFGRSSTTLGSVVHLNGAAFTIIGVAAQTFRGSYDALGTDIWVPLMTHSIVRPRGNDITRRGWGWLNSTARLHAGVSLAEAQAELSTIANALRQEHSSVNNAFQVNVVQALALPEEMAPTLRSVLLFVLVVIGLALAAACANVANTQLATVIERQREIAVRLALGATRARIVRQWFTESVLLATAATLAGLLVALWARDAIMAMQPPMQELQNLGPNLSFDWRVLVFVTSVAAIATILFAGLPALRAAQIDVSGPLKEDAVTMTGSRRRSRAQSALVVAQVAVSLALLVVAGLLVRSLDAASAFDVGFDRRNLVIAEATLSGLSYDAERTRAYYRQTIERVRALPGVEDVTLAVVVPLGGMAESRGVIIDGYTPPPPAQSAFVSIATNIVAPDYFRFMNIPIVQGRGFVASDADDTAAVVAIVNESMARRFWPAENPIGRRIRFSNKTPWVEVVGVARDITYYSIGEAPRPYLYVSFGPTTASSAALHIRTSAADASLLQALRRELRAPDPRIRVPIAMPYDQLRQLPLYPGRVMATVSTAFGTMALLLTLVGLYGVVMYAVSQRTREFAVRMALGARPRDILHGVLKQGVKIAIAGVLVGIGAAAALVQLLRGFLFGVSSFDPLTFGGWALFLMGAALLAAYLPARRATKIDPAAAISGRVD